MSNTINMYGTSLGVEAPPPDAVWFSREDYDEIVATNERMTAKLDRAIDLVTIMSERHDGYKAAIDRALALLDTGAVGAATEGVVRRVLREAQAL